MPSKSKPQAVFLWRKLDYPGHDSCRLFALAGGWRLSGAAVFREARRTCCLQYEVIASRTFRTKSARVVGYLGRRAVDIGIRSTGYGRWRVGGRPRMDLAGCLDVDLGFTPATNLLPIRRLALRVGEAAQAPAAYLRFPSMRFTKLPQRYQRTAPDEYAYESPTAGYAGTLRVSSVRAVIEYPGLFELVTGS